MTARLEGAIDCDVHPSVPGLSALLPLSRRLLARHDRGARHRGLREPGLSAAGGGERAARLAGRSDPRRRERGEGQGAAARPLAARRRDPELRLRRPADQRRGPRGGAVHGGQRLAGEGVAGPGPAPCGLDRDPDAEPGARRPGDRAPDRRPALRPDPDAGDARSALRPQLLVADLRAGRPPRAAGRAPSRQRLPARDHRDRLALLPRRGLRRSDPRHAGAAREPDQPRRVRASSRTSRWC